ncbi:four helix bundle protein [Coraliomargarita sp. SDUM461004]|uniref:Four helix bundle protein n=1 Tax=Thalassobacterium sedimentorum TaxID=3041258 RepID=A0ABU1AHJ2_9BACT|nr:four helix bundle protein [Coraliomargarita sp. SDUM461004]MDQ8193103.1 four helix bundle protein [Coraliomargarita sp. SDUM461004]
MKLDNFGALIKANKLFDHVVNDLRPLKTEFACKRLVEQQFASADSIAANIEEGYGRGSRKDYRHFLIISRGSAQETKGRYGRLKHWLKQEDIEARQKLCDEIIAILSKTINTLGQ